MIKVIIGLEIHLELLTKRKAFSNAETSFSEEPNTCVSEIDLGYPGTLPLIEKELIIQGLKACHIFNMEISKEITFDRKHYQYPDLPKGFQITQFFQPIGRKGSVTLDSGKKISITEIHLEEDTAKRVYLENKVHIDYNRCGKPLLEIVTDPVFNNKEEVIEFLKWLRSEVINSQISEGAMEKGSLRCDVNINLYDEKTKLFTNRVEVKNINSFRFISDAIDFEVKHQTQCLKNNEFYPQQTKRFDMETKTTKLMRTKDSVLDYRYMPEPNILPINVKREWIDEAASLLPMSIKKMKDLFKVEWKVTKEVWEPIISNKTLLDIFNSFIVNTKNPKTIKKVASWVSVNLSEIIRKEVDIDLDSKRIGMSLEYIHESLEKGIITSDSLQDIFKQLLKNENIESVVLKHKINDKFSLSDIEKTVQNVIDENSVFIKDNVQERRDRVEKMIMGQVMKKTRGQIKPQEVIKLVKQKLEETIF